jgi:hypothetical protein
MADETNTNAPASQEPNGSRAEERIIDLSSKVKEQADLRQAAEDKLAEANRKLTFTEGYADMVAINPAAKEFKADIEAKVMSGYTVEDAAYAVLGKAGKLGNAPAPAPGATEVAGGSAVVNPSQSEKSVGEMSQDERRAALDKALQIN